ncbi:hypothetical protein HC891_02250 [Candidatus Gracilibacteria bacterium]|nr:hypothetical protein [Candidatus Gracilibacteria bacterium]
MQYNQAVLFKQCQARRRPYIRHLVDQVDAALGEVDDRCITTIRSHEQHLCCCWSGDQLHTGSGTDL